MTFSYEEILQIISSHTDLSSKKINKLIEEQIEKHAGLLTEEGAALLTARDLGVKLYQIKKDKQDYYQLANIQGELSNLSIRGRVLNKTKIKTFDRKDGSTGHTCSLLLKDNTGEIKVTLWDDLAKKNQELKIKKGTVLDLSNVYVKRDRNERLVVHSSNQTSIRIIENAGPEQFPLPPKKLIKIEDIDLGVEDFEVKAKIVDQSNVNSFQREDGTQGKVINLLLMDQTGQIYISFWNDAVEKALELIEQSVDIILIRSPLVKRGLNERIELVYVKFTQIEPTMDPELEKITVKQKLEGQSTRIHSLVEIKDIKPTSGPLSTAGIVTKNFGINVYTKRNNTEGQVGSFIIIDPTGNIRVVCWNDKADLMKEVKEGDKVKIVGFKPRESNRYDATELHSISGSEIEINPPDIKLDPQDFFVNIAEIYGNKDYISIRVELIDKGEVNIFKRKDGTNGKVINAKIEDPTGQAKLVAWDDNVNKLEDIELGEWVEITALKTKFEEEIELTLTDDSKIKKLEKSNE